MKPKRKTPASEVRAFRQRHGLTQPALDRLLGFTSEGMAVGRWEREDAPYYASLIFKLVDAHGIDLMKQLQAEGRNGRALRAEVQAFREKHKLSGAALDKLFGLSSGGRATRRWEDPLENGAPSYITIMMAYCSEFSCDTLFEALEELQNETKDD